MQQISAKKTAIPPENTGGIHKINRNAAPNPGNDRCSLPTQYKKRVNNTP
jgi:hypothetical protein